MSETLQVCDTFFQLHTKHITCEAIMQEVDLALREKGTIRGMNERTIQAVRQTSLEVISKMKYFLENGLEEGRAYELALEETLKENM